MFYECIKKEVGLDKSFLWLMLLRVLLVGTASTQAVLLFRVASILKKNNHNVLSHFFKRKFENKFGIYIHLNANIKPGLTLPHPVGIVIGQGVKIDEDVVIYQHVTLGGARRGDMKTNNYPSIGSGTVIFSGAVVIGNVKIGKNCVIGANAVVTKDISDNATAVGIPARVIEKTKIWSK
jgi:serine O-acetyltransferase